MSDFDEFDYIFVMDKYNMRDVRAFARSESDGEKVKLLLGNKEVPDPYFEDAQFEPVFQLIEAGCRDIIKKLKPL
jgi:protein-tyrosine phosphatase